MINRNIIIVSIFTLTSLVFADVRNPGRPSASRYPSPSRNVNTYSAGRYQLGNDIVTGNVSGGKHFRGFVPYGSTYEFRGSQGTSTLNDFYRRSTSVADIQSQSSYQTQRYLLSSRSVASTQKSSPSSVQNKMNLTKPSYRINLAPQDLTRVDLNSSTDLLISEDYRVNQRPMNMELSDIKVGLDSYYDRQEKQAQLEKHLEPQPTDLSDALSKSTDRKTTLFSPLLRAPEKTDSSLEMNKFESRFEKKIEDEDLIAKEARPDVYQQMLEKIQEDFAARVEQGRLAKIEESEKAKQQEIEKRLANQERINRLMKKSRSAFRERRRSAEEAVVSEEQEKVELPETIKSFASSKRFDSFNKYMTQAEEFLKAGKFYKAADAYSLAGAYQDFNPLPYAGRSIALFGAGEYMSSAYYLNMSFRIFEELALFKIDITDFISDSDLLGKRMAELAELQIQSDSPELRFLQAYLYYSSNQTHKAVEAINDASKKLGDDPAVIILKNAIETLESGQSKNY